MAMRVNTKSCTMIKGEKHYLAYIRGVGCGFYPLRSLLGIYKIILAAEKSNKKVVWRKCYGDDTRSKGKENCS